MNALEIQDLSFSYNSHQNVISHLTLSIPSQEFVAILGKSGCGKTTLLNLISGLLEPSEGEVRFRSTQRINCPLLEVTYLTQTPTLLAYRTAMENAVLGLELRNTLDRDTFSRVDELFNLFEIQSAKNLFTNELSGGMRQRVALIQSIVIDSSLYLFDEPFSAIDRNNSHKIEQYIWNKLKTKGATILLVTHTLEQALSFCDRIILLPSDPDTKVAEYKLREEFLILSPDERRNSDIFSLELFELVKRFSRL